MSRRVLVIENFTTAFDQTAEDIARLFRADHWLLATCGNNVVSAVEHDACWPFPEALQSPGGALSFYQKLAAALPADAVIFRVRNPSYPLQPLLADEIQEQFAEDRFHYVLSTGVECGLTGFFLERLNKAVLDELAGHKVALMPDGYFNGMACRNSGRHWFSLELRRFYLKDHFETLFDSPRVVAINSIPQCNYRCLKCQYRSPMLTDSQTFGPPMTVERFKVILEKCKGYKRLASISPTISGEPLLHPEIVEMVRLIKDAGYVCGFATNASLLSEELGKKLLDAGVDSLAFSVDSVNPATYRKLQGGALEDVEKNVLAFQKATLQARGSFYGTMICVVSEENVGELEEYRARWLDRGFAVLFSAEHQIGLNFQPFFAHTEWAPQQRMPCFALWHGLYLTDQGRALSCGAMAKGSGLKESIFEQEPADLWRCRSLQALREQQLAGKTPGYCQQFSCWTGLMTTWVHKDDRLICHTQGSWLESPPAAEPLPAPSGTGRLNKLHLLRRKVTRLLAKIR
jgi:pyruvate-formate lyase-activating enzyme